MPLALHRSAALLALALAVGLSGCGPGKATVSGKVTYNGNSLNKPDGTILFLGPDGTQVTASIAPDGTYTANGVAHGENKVAVYYTSAPPTGGAGPKGRLPQPGAPKAGAGSPADGNPYITPADYANPDTSKLTVNVGKDTVYNPALTGPPIK